MGLFRLLQQLPPVDDAGTYRLEVPYVVPMVSTEIRTLRHTERGATETETRRLVSRAEVNLQQLSFRGKRVSNRLKSMDGFWEAYIVQTRRKWRLSLHRVKFDLNTKYGQFISSLNKEYSLSTMRPTWLQRQLSVLLLETDRPRRPAVEPVWC